MLDVINQWLMLLKCLFYVTLSFRHDIIDHKAIHRYTVRAKRGTSQSLRDAKQRGHGPKSAGATIRRRNEATLVTEIQELLRKWKEHVDHCEKIFIKWPQNARQILYGGKSPVFDKTDTRLRKIPFATGKPTFGEIKRIHSQLTLVRIQDAGKSTKDEEYGNKPSQNELIENVRAELSLL
eukprot:gene3296-3778_t